MMEFDYNTESIIKFTRKLYINWNLHINNKRNVGVALHSRE